MKKDNFFEGFEEDEFDEDVFSEDNEYYDDDDYDPEDRDTGSCAFCGGKTYGDMLCPDCANNVD